jgi:ABC-type dipeptide/oligopeptide/nickel transport system ATPase subunit
MFNPMMQMISQMMSQGAANPQAMVEQILRQNPQFAQRIQGQNVQNMAQDLLKQRGIDPSSIQDMLRKR